MTGSVIQLDPDLIEVDRIALYPLQSSLSAHATPSHTPLHPSPMLRDGHIGQPRGIHGRHPSNGSAASIIAPTLGRSVRNAKPYLVSSLQRRSGAAGDDDEEAASEAEGQVPIWRVAFRYDAQPDEPGMLPVRKRVEWGRWLDKDERWDFAEEVVKR